MQARDPESLEEHEESALGTLVMSGVGDPAEAFGTPGKGSEAAAGNAPEGWSETTPGGNQAKAGTGLAMAAEAAKLSETGALGFVGVDGMGSVIEAVQRNFNALAISQEGGAQTLSTRDAPMLAMELRKEETVKLLLSEPARMRESDGQYDTLEVVLTELAAFGKDWRGGRAFEIEDVYNLFGLGGPDLADYESTSTFLTVEDSEVREKILNEHLSEETCGAIAQLVYFGGLGKSHLSKNLQASWQGILAADVRQAVGN